MLKLADNPPLIYPDAGVLTISDGRWWVGHTKARFEKSFARDLQAKHIAYLFPLIDRVRMSGGKRRRSLTPLFPSYVFFRGDEMARYTALTTGRLCRVIEIRDQQRLIAELSAVYRALDGHAELEPYPMPVVGERCRIGSGAFQGLEGVIVRVNETARLVLQIGILGQGASMEIDAGQIEMIDGRTRRSVVTAHVGGPV